MSDEKWILHNNVEWKRLWGKWNEPPPTTPKTSLLPKKVMLYMWWYWKGVLYYELLQENQRINSNKYFSQLDQLKEALDEKHPELVNRKCIIFHQDNARPHVSLMIRQKSLQLGRKVLIHLLYPPGIAPSCFTLFLPLQNSLNGKNFNSLDNCRRHWEQLFAQRDKSFGRVELLICLKNGSSSRNKMMNIFFNKVLGENEKCVIYFCLKIKGTFWTIQIFTEDLLAGEHCAKGFIHIILVWSHLFPKLSHNYWCNNYCCFKIKLRHRKVK